MAWALGKSHHQVIAERVTRMEFDRSTGKWSLETAGGDLRRGFDGVVVTGSKPSGPSSLPSIRISWMPSKGLTIPLRSDVAAHRLHQPQITFTDEPASIEMTIEPNGTAAKAQAEALFRRSGHGEDDVVRRVQEEARQADAEKTARLRALRMAKEESDRIATEVGRAKREQRRP